MRSVFAKANIGDDNKVWHSALKGSDGALNDAVFVVGFAAPFVLAFGDAKEQDGGDAQLGDLFGVPHQLVHADAKDAGHGRHFLPLLFAGHDEHRVDEVVDAQSRLAHHSAQGFRSAQSAHPNDGEGHHVRSPALLFRTNFATDDFLFQVCVGSSQPTNSATASSKVRRYKPTHALTACVH
jgi:hypothetical protein